MEMCADRVLTDAVHAGIVVERVAVMDSVAVALAKASPVVSVWSVIRTPEVVCRTHKTVRVFSVDRATMDVAPAETVPDLDVRAVSVAIHPHLSATTTASVAPMNLWVVARTA